MPARSEVEPRPPSAALARGLGVELAGKGGAEPDAELGSSAIGGIGVPKRAEESDESSTTTRASDGKVDPREVDELAALLALLASAMGSGEGDDPLSVLRNGERVRVGSLRNVDEPGRDARCRPVGDGG